MSCPSDCDPSRISMCSSMMLSWSPSPVETLRFQPRDSQMPLRKWNRRTEKLEGQDLRRSSMYATLIKLVFPLAYIHRTDEYINILPFMSETFYEPQNRGKVKGLLFPLVSFTSHHLNTWWTVLWPLVSCTTNVFYFGKLLSVSAYLTGTFCTSYGL